MNRYWSKSAFFKWVDHLKRKFQVEGTSPTYLFWCQKTRLITLSCSIKIVALYSFFSSESTRVSDGRTDKQNYDPQNRASIAASRGKINVEKMSCEFEEKKRNPR